MRLDRYDVVAIEPAENASGGKGVQCSADRCAATVKFDKPAGWYELDVQYFDMPEGEAKFAVFLNKQPIDQWTASDRLPARHLGADSSTRRWIPGLALRPGDEIRIEATPADKDPAALDYIEFRAQPRARTAKQTGSVSQPQSRRTK